MLWSLSLSEQDGFSQKLQVLLDVSLLESELIFTMVFCVACFPFGVTPGNYQVNQDFHSIL